eukprot:jgi/Botrbrau1/8009/Bobra.384_2s0031.1
MSSLLALEQASHIHPPPPTSRDLHTVEPPHVPPKIRSTPTPCCWPFTSSWWHLRRFKHLLGCVLISWPCLLIGCKGM